MAIPRHASPFINHPNNPQRLRAPLIDQEAEWRNWNLIFLGSLFLIAILTILWNFLFPPANQYDFSPTTQRFDRADLFMFRKGIRNHNWLDHFSKDERSHLDFDWNDENGVKEIRVPVEADRFYRESGEKMKSLTSMHLQFGRNFSYSFHVIHKIHPLLSMEMIFSVVDVSDVEVYPEDNKHVCFRATIYTKKYKYKVKAKRECAHIKSAMERWGSSASLYVMQKGKSEYPTDIDVDINGDNRKGESFGLWYSPETNIFDIRFSDMNSSNLSSTLVSPVSELKYEIARDGHIHVTGTADSGEFKLTKDAYTWPLSLCIDRFMQEPRYYDLQYALLVEKAQYNPFENIEATGIKDYSTIMTNDAQLAFSPYHFDFVHGEISKEMTKYYMYAFYYEKFDDVCMKLVFLNESIVLEYNDVTFKDSANHPWGVGVNFNPFPWKVTSVHVGLQAEKLGVRKGCVVLKWNGEDVSEKNQVEIKQHLIVGDPGTITFFCPTETKSQSNEPLEILEMYVDTNCKIFKSILRYKQKKNNWRIEYLPASKAPKFMHAFKARYHSD